MEHLVEMPLLAQAQVGGRLGVHPRGGRRREA
jgi:hypothetical protein